MKRANRISEIINAFSPEPLKVDQMAEFYCDDTMEYRMSDKYSSPIEDIFEICQEENSHSAFLLLGHKGCGKSTELNRLSNDLHVKGYQVKTIVCSMDLDMFNIVYSDLFILMGEALLEIAEECGCRIEEAVLDRIMHFWDAGEETFVSKGEEALLVEAGAAAETPGILRVLHIFAKIKADLKYNEEVRKEYRKKISVRSSEWIEVLRSVSKEIVGKTGGKAPVIIFEAVSYTHLTLPTN